MGTFKTYDSVGVKEDVSDVITMLNKHETPFTSSLSANRTVTQKTYEWQEDEQEPGQDNAQLEGFEAVEEDCTTTEMRSNTTQIFSRTIKLSGSVEATEFYGRASELARQLVKKGKALKLDRERACVGVDQAAVLGSSTTPRRHASVTQLIDPSCKISNASGGNPAPLAETTLREAIRNNYAQGAKARRFMVAPYVAEQTAEFAGNASRTRQVTDKNATEIVHVVDVYTTALGTLTIETNREMKPDLGLLWNPADWKSVTLKGRAWFRETLAKTGDNTKIMIAGEYGLQHNNFKASTVVTDIAE